MLALTTQVLLRPRRIGTLVVLGGMTGVVVVGAEGWWTVLGIALFQLAACALIVTWVDIAQIVRSGRRTRPRRTSRGLLPGRPESPCGVIVAIPQPRRPTADEYRAGE